jgi:signal transduction histidine kinase
LDAGRIRNGKLDLNITSYNLDETLSAAIETVQLAYPGHSIFLTGMTGLLVTGDKERIRQVIVNLLTNAIKYSPDAHEVGVNVVEENGLVIVSVKDNGVGIRKENLEKIFELYYREERQATSVQGLGLGLFICQEIIHRHGGKIWAESVPGEGSVFYFAVPLNISK